MHHPNTKEKGNEMTSPFTALVQEESSVVKPADLQGHLLIIKPIEYIESIMTKIGESEAVVIELIDLDTNEHFAKVLFFNKVLVSALKPNIGKSVLARIGQGVAKPGKSAPWILMDATTDAEAVAKATAYLAGTMAPPVEAKPANAVVNGIEVTPEILAMMEKLGATTVAK
jgi:hypothetical protein